MGSRAERISMKRLIVVILALSLTAVACNKTASVDNEPVAQTAPEVAGIGIQQSTTEPQAEPSTAKPDKPLPNNLKNVPAPESPHKTTKDTKQDNKLEELENRITNLGNTVNNPSPTPTPTPVPTPTPTPQPTPPVVAPIVLATASLSGVTSSPSETIGGEIITIWQSSLTIGVQNVKFQSLRLRQIGSINSVYLTDFILYINDVQVASVASIPSSDYEGYIKFDLNSELTPGMQMIKVTTKVSSDVAFGSAGRTIQFSLRNKSDFVLIDSEHNQTI